MSFAEYDQYDGLGLAGLVQKGQVSAAELCNEAITRIETLNPALNAVVTPMYEQARAAAAAPAQGPFAGVPILVKDLSYAVAGVPYTEGSRALARFVPDHDSEMVLRFKAAGAVICGKTNTPEFGLLGITEPELFGPCRNPWDPSRTPGGSSGGSAAAVAAGMVPLAAGGDGGGSIRIPSAYCGLFGLKPSRGRTPTGPDHGQVWQGAVVDHVLTRSVRDSAAMLDATCGPDPGAPYIIAPPARPYLEELESDPAPLRVALCTDSPLGGEVHPHCARAAVEAGLLLRELGHEVSEDAPDIDGPSLAASYLAMYFGETAARLSDLETVLGRKAGPGDVEPLTFTMALLGRTFSAGFMVENLHRWGAAARSMGRFFQRYDLYLIPTTAQPPARIGGLAPAGLEALLMKTVNALRLGRLLKAAGLVDGMAARALARTPFTQLANLCGLPAMSVPLYQDPEGLPQGAQFVAPFGREDLLLSLAAQLERARPWFERRPGR